MEKYARLNPSARPLAASPKHRLPGRCGYNGAGMFKRIRQLRISLAAKCQMLFGAAVALIIAAALFVPWQRMEQLTE